VSVYNEMMIKKCFGPDLFEFTWIHLTCVVI